MALVIEQIAPDSQELDPATTLATKGMAQNGENL